MRLKEYFRKNSDEIIENLNDHSFLVLEKEIIRILE